MLFPFRASGLLLVCLALLGGSATSRAGMTQYTDRGKTDFDTALQILNPYGTWSKIEGAWAYTPLDHGAPYTDGRWIYTEYGWYWKGNRPHSWVTEHYGYWKRGADKTWSWYPGPYWIPQTVEIRSTSTHIGWRSAAVDDDGNFTEEPEVRWSKPDEWIFVTLAQFAGPITPKSAAPPNVAQQLLDDSTESLHSYWTYREIDRPGPHPADFLALCQDGGMFAPKTLADQLAAQAPPPRPPLPGVLPPHSSPPATSAPVNAFSNTAFADTSASPTVDKRKVKYWITMSLPTYWAQPPAEAKPEEIYLYRPDFYQDNDGIARRITLWFNPKSRTNLRDLLAGERTTPKATPSATSNAPAAPAEPVPSSDPFRSPFEDSYHFHSGTASPNSSKNPLPPPAPAGTAADEAPIPSPLVNATNSAPVPPR